MFQIQSDCELLCELFPEDDTSFTYNVTGLSAFTKYKLEITAINLGGEGAPLTKEDEDTTTAQDGKLANNFLFILLLNCNMSISVELSGTRKPSCD